MIKKIITHVRRWNLWRKNCLNDKLYKFLVLIGFIKAPTMAFIWLPEEHKKIIDAINQANTGYSLTAEEVNVALKTVNK